MFDFKNLLFEVSRQEPLVANILMQMPKQLSLELEAPAAVSVSNSCFTLLYNPVLMQEYLLSDQIVILLHEIMHVVNDHHLRGISKEKNLWNCACDLAVNSVISDRASEQLREDMLLPEVYKLPSSKTAEWYYNMLKDSGFVFPEINHSWTTGVSSSNLVKQAESVTGVSAQPIILDASLLPSKLDWKRILNGLVQSRISEHKRSSHRRMSRRFKRPPGKQRAVELPAIVAVLDTSESISVKTLQLFTKEVCKLSIKNGCQLIVVECDEIVRRVYKFKQGQVIDEVVGKTGTAFAPAFKEIEQLSKINLIGCVVYFTDGYSSDSHLLEKPKCPVIWVYPNEQFPKTVDWGQHCYAA